MKTAIIGDIHGRTLWERLNINNFDKLIFIGDYFDSHNEINGRHILDNFNNIVNLKSKNREDVILLFGNHDYHYIAIEKYSGYNSLYSFDYKEAIQNSLHLLNLAYELNKNTIVSHAGISKTWMIGNKIKEDDLYISLHDFLSKYPDSLEFCGRDMYGDDVTQSPIWIRENALLRDSAFNTQIIGHTMKKKMCSVNNFGTTLWFVDVLDTKRQYLLWDEKEFNIVNF